MAAAAASSASGGGRSAEHLAWEASVKAAAASGGPKPDEKGEYRCRYPGCTRVFTMPGALHTHTGWHKRKENISAGVYDRLGHHLKEIHSMADAQGRVTVLEVYRCDFPGCGKLFQSRGALHTHQGWHKRRPKEGQTFMVQQVQKRSGVVMVETPRKRVRREDFSGKPIPQLAADEQPAGAARPPAAAPEIDVQADSDAAAALGLLAALSRGDDATAAKDEGASPRGGLSGGGLSGGMFGGQATEQEKLRQQAQMQFSQLTQQQVLTSQLTQQNAWAGQMQALAAQQMQAQQSLMQAQQGAAAAAGQAAAGQAAAGQMVPPSQRDRADQYGGASNSV